MISSTADLGIYYLDITYDTCEVTLILHIIGAKIFKYNSAYYYAYSNKYGFDSLKS